MRPCREQEARDALEDLGLAFDDDRTEDLTPTPQGPLPGRYTA